MRRTGSNYGIIVAAGTGRRFGGLKQFEPLKRRPLVAWALAAFQSCPVVTGFVVVAPASKLALVRGLAQRLKLTRMLAAVPGGRTRASSVRSGLEALPGDGYVAVHDGVRPLLTPAMLAAGFRLCRRYGAATYATPVTDTLKRVAGGRVERTLERGPLYAVQTPQFFPIPLLRQAYAAAGPAADRATDDCMLVEALGIRPRVIEGPRRNIKVTTPEDLELAGAWL